MRKLESSDKSGVCGALTAKVRYRGLVKNANRAFALLALINLDKWGVPLTGQVRPEYAK